MLIDLNSKTLYTEEGELIKKMYCPKRVQWEELPNAQEKYRMCLHCSNKIVDTAFYSDQELKAMVKENSETCFKVDLNQSNVFIK